MYTYILYGEGLALLLCVHQCLVGAIDRNPSFVFYPVSQRTPRLLPNRQGGATAAQLDDTRISGWRRKRKRRERKSGGGRKKQEHLLARSVVPLPER